MGSMHFDDNLPRYDSQRLRQYIESKIEDSEYGYKHYDLFFGIRFLVLHEEGIRKEDSCYLTRLTPDDLGLRGIDFGVLTHLNYDDILEIDFAYSKSPYQISNIFYLHQRDQIYKGKKYLHPIEVSIDQLLTIISIPDEDFVRSALINFNKDKPLESLKYSVDILRRVRENEKEKRKLEEKRRLEEFYYHRFEEVI